MIQHRAAKERDQLEELAEVVSGDTTLLGVDIAPKPRRLLGALLKHDLVTKDVAMTAMYYDVHIDDRPEATSVGVYLTHLRRFTTAHGIEIHTQRGDGWYIKRADKAKLLDIIAGLKTAVPLRQKKAPGGVKAPERQAFEVVYDVPLPTLSEVNRKWPWEKLDRPGASTKPLKADRKDVHRSLRAFRELHPERQFALRQVAGGVVVWRVEDKA